MDKIRQKRIDMEEIRSRAAEIRRHWSPMEKTMRRATLPPDMPLDLRRFVLRQPQLAWSAAAPAPSHRPISIW